MYNEQTKDLQQSGEEFAPLTETMEQLKPDSDITSLLKPLVEPSESCYTPKEFTHKKIKNENENKLS